MKIVTVLLPEGFFKYVDELVRGGWYQSRSAFIRSVVRDALAWYLECDVKVGGNGEMRIINLHMPRSYLRALETLVRKGFYANIVEAVRDGVRRLLEEYGFKPMLREVGEYANKT